MANLLGLSIRVTVESKEGTLCDYNMTPVGGNAECPSVITIKNKIDHFLAVTNKTEIPQELKENLLLYVAKIACQDKTSERRISKIEENFTNLLLRLDAIEN